MNVVGTFYRWSFVKGIEGHVYIDIHGFSCGLIEHDCDDSICWASASGSVKGYFTLRETVHCKTYFGTLDLSYGYVYDLLKLCFIQK